MVSFFGPSMEWMRVRAHQVGSVWRQHTRVLRACGVAVPLALPLAPQALAQGLIVSENGQPAYTQAISVPPGIAGMEPKLAISHSPGANGPLGYGWALQGLSTISRCPNNRTLDGSTHAVDLTPQDKLCLDGQRLIRTDENGTPMPFPQSGDSLGLTSGYREFRTEKDSYARIRTYGQSGGNVANGPAYIKVWTKSGLVYEYGNNANATANATLVQQGGTAVAVWGVSRVSDTLGNYMDFQYAQRDTAWGSGPSTGATSGREWNLMEIRYTGNGSQAPANKVVFDYVDRVATPGEVQDRFESYANGSKILGVRLLQAVRTYINSPNSTVLGPATAAVKVKTFKLKYETAAVSHRSRLKSMVECVGGDEDKCVPATVFAYLNGGNEEFAANEVFKGGDLSTLKMHSADGSYGALLGDFNGDGRLDIIRWSNNPSENQLWTSMGNGDFKKENAFNILDENIFKSDGCYSSMVYDLNGDGLPDLLRYSSSSAYVDGHACVAYGGIYSYINMGGGVFDKKEWVGPELKRTFGVLTCEAATDGDVATSLCRVSVSEYFYLFDINADGKLDVIATISPGSSYFCGDPGLGYVCPISNIQYNPCPNGVCTRVWLANRLGGFDQVQTNVKNRSFFVYPYVDDDGRAPRTMGSNVADVDGDGLLDLIKLNLSQWNDSSTYRSRGDGNFDPVRSGGACGNYIDFNGDAKADCLTLVSGTPPTLSVSKGNNAFQPVSSFNLVESGQDLIGGNLGMISMDINGDGRTDILRWSDDPTQNKVYISNGDGTFRQSTTFNLNTASDKLISSDGSTLIIQGDFTGHGAVEFLRLKSSPNATSDATRNQLYVKADPTPPDLLISATSGTGLKTTLTYVPLSNSASGSLGERYKSDRGTSHAAVYPQVDVTPPTYVVATSVTDTGVGNATITTEYSYAGLKSSFDGQGLLGFRETRRQGPGADGRPLTIVTQSLQAEPYVGTPSYTETRLGTLDSPNAPLLSRSRQLYCDKSAASGAAEALIAAAGSSMAAGYACAVPAGTAIKRPYLLSNRTESWDLQGNLLPTITATNSYNLNGDPTQIVVKTEGSALGLPQTYTKTTTNTYQPDNTSGERWILGRLQKATQRNTVPNSLASIMTSVGNAPYAGVTQGTGPLPPRPPMQPAVLSIITQYLLDD